MRKLSYLGAYSYRVRTFLRQLDLPWKKKIAGLVAANDYLESVNADLNGQIDDLHFQLIESIEKQSEAIEAAQKALDLVGLMGTDANNVLTFTDALVQQSGRDVQTIDFLMTLVAKPELIPEFTERLKEIEETILAEPRTYVIPRPA